MKIKKNLLILLILQNISLTNTERFLSQNSFLKQKAQTDVRSYKSKSQNYKSNFPQIEYQQQKEINDQNFQGDKPAETITISSHPLNEDFQEQIQQVDQDNDLLKKDIQALETDESHLISHNEDFRKFVYKQEAERIVNYVMYIFFVLTGFYLIFFGSRLTDVSNIIAGYYLSYYFALYSLIFLDKFKPKDLYAQLLLFFSTIALTFILSLFKYLTTYNNIIVFGFSISFTIVAYLNIFVIAINDFEIFVICLAVIISLGIWKQDIINKYGYTLSGSLLTPFHYAVLASEITALELCYDKERDMSQQQKIIGIFLSVSLLIFIVGSLFQYFFQKRFKRGFFLDENYEFRKSSLENTQLKFNNLISIIQIQK